MGALPVAGNVFVGLGQRGIDVDGAEDLVEPDAMLHRQDVFGDQVARMLADDRHAENAVLSRHREDLDEAMRLAVRDGAVEVVDAVSGHFVGNAFSFASSSFSPTRATSGSVNVAQGMTE